MLNYLLAFILFAKSLLSFLIDRTKPLLERRELPRAMLVETKALIKEGKIMFGLGRTEEAVGNHLLPVDLQPHRPPKEVPIST